MAALQRWRQHGKGNDTHREREDMAFKQIIITSQRFLPATNVTQLLTIKRNSLLVTQNRLTPYGFVQYHNSGNIPVIRHQDKGLITTLFSTAHVDRDGQDSMHLSKSLTWLRMKSGRFAVHMPRFGAEIAQCVLCRRELASQAFRTNGR